MDTAVRLISSLPIRDIPIGTENYISYGLLHLTAAVRIFFLDRRKKQEYNIKNPFSDFKGEAMNNIKETHVILNRLCKENDELYHSYAAAIGLSDSALWILYAICDSDEVFTQNSLCGLWCYSKQTVNSTVKQLEKNGLLTLEHICGTRTHKALRLTDRGMDFCRKYIVPLIGAEEKAIAFMTDEEREKFVALRKREHEILKEEIEKIETD